MSALVLVVVVAAVALRLVRVRFGTSRRSLGLGGGQCADVKCLGGGILFVCPLVVFFSGKSEVMSFSD